MAKSLAPKVARNFSPPRCSTITAARDVGFIGLPQYLLPALIALTFMPADNPNDPSKETGKFLLAVNNDFFSLFPVSRDWKCKPYCRASPLAGGLRIKPATAARDKGTCNPH